MFFNVRKIVGTYPTIPTKPCQGMVELDSDLWGLNRTYTRAGWALWSLFQFVRW